MSILAIIIITVALLILAGLSFYAGELLMQLKQQKQQIEQQREQKKQARDNNLIESIQTISHAMESEQCEVSEGALRLAVLFDHLSDAQQVDYVKKYPAIHALNDKIKHFAILEERKKLAKKERMRQDFQRMKAEAEFKDLVIAEAIELKTFSLSK
ncbi:hypothetical protein DS2_06506 [Catenovulum agarivorans DS-2]|uniref:DUF2489 domain-containing protein n=1 Tax=Catenovulum agarivorans DS-2 TaxID=1328313 RepID=W7QG74_9ALTE|nr:DUF2489 domain-containing protein [Catenovulum agarivorans]EWH10921.1 hypothetical protein DS2_06506 [Catenovulum agarivorans DS-2]